MAHGGDEWPPYASVLGLGSWAWENRSLIYGRVTLSGGNPDRMKLRHFLDAAYTLFVEEYRKGGLDLIAAVDAMKRWAQGDGEPAEETPPPTADSLAQLNSMMAGFK